MRTRSSHRNSQEINDFSMDALSTVGRHPFADWYASLWKAKAARWEERDLYLDHLGAKRFAVGVVDRGMPALGICDSDVPALTSIKWTSAAFVFSHRGHDWIALSSKDARVNGAQEMNPVAIRLWIPVNFGLIDAWGKLAPTKLRLCAITVQNGQPQIASGSALAELPMAILKAKD